MATRLGVDVGGTFTDLIFYDEESGEIRVGKVPTTPASPDEGVINVVTSAVGADSRQSAKYFLHGTTVGLNALLTRTGAVVGQLATHGFRDALEIRRGDRDNVYDLYWKQPDPLVPRDLRFGVRGRVLADGTIDEPLALDDVELAAQRFSERGVTAVAIAFINAYVDPRHELEAAEALRRAGFDGAISLSHQVSGEYREYERTSTTVIDAYVRGRMANYLERLDDSIGTAGVPGKRLITRSGGGAMSFVEAAERPFETIMSGPVAGAEGAAELARALDLGDVITADVGGTSFDTALIIRGRPRLIYEGAVAGLTVQSPWIDVRSIGAGGGSIASIDVGGLLQVGPASAGAVPGPACYGRGGTEPTVTDAAFVLGMLGEGRLASGVVLDRTAAVESIAPLADALGLEPEDVARGIVTIANANMANAIRSITIEQGEDPRGAALMPFGGAGPLFGTLLARELEMKNLVLPPYAGNFSAWGLLGADLTQSASRTRLLRLGPEGIVAANEVLAELFMKLERRRQGHDDDAFEREVRLDMRYVGQEHTITITVPVTDAGAIAVGPEEIEASFTEEYSQRFGHTMPVPVEISSVRATTRTPLPERRMGYRSPGTNGNGGSTVSAYSFTRGDRLDFQIVERSALVEGDVVEGPAIVVEETATTYLDADFVGQVGAAAALHITDTGQEA